MIVYTCIYMYIHVYTCIYMYIYIYIHTFIYIYIYIYINAYVYSSKVESAATAEVEDALLYSEYVCILYIYIYTHIIHACRARFELVRDVGLGLPLPLVSPLPCHGPVRCASFCLFARGRGGGRAAAVAADAVMEGLASIVAPLIYHMILLLRYYYVI